MNNNIETIFATARELQSADRSGYLDDACGGDTELRSQVEALLAADMDAGSFLKSVEHDPDATLPQTRFIDKPDIPSETAGQLIGKYKLLQSIGEGGFGTVWMAEQKEPVKRRVALKIIKLGMDTKQVIARFEAERQALAMMDHPNIAKVFDAGSTETGRPFFVMELVKGVPILEYCDREKLDTKSRLNLFTLVCNAIQHAHQKGIIHRDIKPGNVLVTLHDGVPVPKVIDFGIAKATSQELTQKTLFTEHHQMIGTPAYMSPEQAEMSGLDIDTRSDIYSLGVLLYELLTGTTPFAHKELMERGFGEMMRIIREETPHKPSTRLSTLGETGTRTAEQRHTDIRKLGLVLRGDLDWIVMKCLEKDRTRRYDTANGLAADIVRHLSDEPVVAGPPSAGYKVRKFVKRNRGQVIAGGAIAAMLVIGMVGTSSGMAWALQEKDRADAQTTRAEMELDRATEIKRLIKEMLKSVTPERALGADITLLKGILDDASLRLSSGEITDELIAAELHGVVGDVYLRLGLHPQSEAHLRESLEIRTRVLGNEDIVTLGTMNSLAVLRIDQKKFTDAEALLLQANDIYQRIFGAEHPDTLYCAHNLAIIYSEQLRFADAEPLMLEILEIRERILDAGDLDIQKSMGNLAFLYYKQARLTEAEELYLRTLEIAERNGRVDHPATLSYMHNLAVLYSDQGRLDEAEALYLRSLEIQKRVLGEEHPDTLANMTSYGVCLWEQAKYAEAETLNLRTLEIKERIFGDDHTSTLGTVINLGSVYNATERHGETVALLENRMPVIRRVMGDKHPWTVNAVMVLAEAFERVDRVDDAISLYEEKLTIQAQVSGEEHPDTLKIMNNLVILYMNQNNFAQAEALSLRTLEIKKRVLGEEHRSTLGGITNLGNLYNRMGRYEDAAEQFEASLPIKRRVLGNRHAWTSYAMSGLADAYKNLGRHDEAMPLWKELFEWQISVADTPDVVSSTLNSMARLLLIVEFEEFRDPKRAWGYAERACDMEEASGGGNLWQYLDTLSLAQHHTGDTAAAVATQQRALDLMPEGADPDMARRLAAYEAALAQSNESNSP